MKVLIEDITDEGLVVDAEDNFDAKDVPVTAPVRTHLGLSRTGREIGITGSIRADLRLQCSRCLKDFSATVDVPVNVVYHPIEEISSEGRELKGDEMDMGFYKGEELDITELVREQLLLNIGMKPLCDEACKGICPKCGTDLNVSGCACDKKELDPRLEVLKKLFEKGKE